MGAPSPVRPIWRDREGVTTLHHGLGLGWVFFGLGQNGLGLGWVWVGFNPVKLLKIHYEDLKSKERKKYY